MLGKLICFQLSSPQKVCRKLIRPSTPKSLLTPGLKQPTYSHVLAKTPAFHVFQFFEIMATDDKTVCSNCTENQLIEVVGRDSSAEVEYHPPHSTNNNAQPKKVRVVGATKTTQRKPTTDSNQAVSRDRRQKSDVAPGQKPVWNCNVRRRTAPVTQSDRDPGYEW